MVSSQNLKQLIEQASSDYLDVLLDDPQRILTGDNRIEAHLSSDSARSLSTEDRQKLFISLISCEIKLARRAGIVLTAKTLHGRFPEQPIELFEELLSLPELPASERGTSLPPRFKKVETIGVGGLGIVWRVFDEQMQRNVAIKMLKSIRRSDWTADQRLRKEATLTGGLQHPGIPPIYDQGELTDGSPFFAMKLVEGKTLAEILKDKTHDTESLVNVFQQITQTIAYAHSNNIIHRDIKPANVMVGEFGEVQVMDWGMAKRIELADETEHKENICPKSSTETMVSSNDSSLASLGLVTRLGNVIGTPAYMSPEQARGESNTASTPCDVFGLGLVLFEILAGRRLYDEPTADEVLKRASQGEFEPVRDVLVDRNVDPDLISICDSCLQVGESDRPADARIVAASLAEYQANVKTRLRKAEIERTSAVVQSLEQKKRTRVTAILSAIVVTVSLIGAAGFAWQWKKAAVAAADAIAEAETRKDFSDFFIYDFLRRADPDVEPDRDLKVRTILDRAAERVEGRFSTKPEIEADVRLQIGIIYFGLGEYQKAQHQIKIAYEKTKMLLGEKHEKTLMAYQHLAGCENALGHNEIAEGMLRWILNQVESRYGIESDEANNVKASLVGALNEQGKYDESESLIRSVVAWQEKDNDDPTRLATSQITLATTLGYLGRYDESEKILNRVLQLLEGVLVREGDKVSIIGSMGDVKNSLNATEGLAFVHESRRHFEMAEQLRRNNIELARCFFGDEHVSTSVYEDNLAICLLGQRKSEEAAELAINVVSRFEQNLGPEHEKTIGAKNTLASAALFQGDFELAEKMFLQLEETLESLHVFPHPDLIVNANNLAGLYMKMGRRDDSIKAFRRAVEGNRSLFTDEHPQTVITIASLADALRKFKEFEEAEVWFKESLKRGKAVFAEDHADTLKTKTDLAFLYQQTAQWEKAEAIYLDILPTYTKQLDRDDPKLGMLNNMLAISYLMQEKFEKAIPYYEVVLDAELRRSSAAETRAKNLFFSLLKCEGKAKKYASMKSRIHEYQKKLDPIADQWLWLNLESRRGKAMFCLGELDQAETVLLEAFKKQEQAKGVEDESKRSALRTTAVRLIKLYEAKEDEAEADLWKQKHKSLK